MQDFLTASRLHKGSGTKDMSVIAGVVVANLVKWGIPSISGMAIASLVSLAGEAVCRNR